MINNVVLTGRIIEEPKLRETATGIKYATVLLEVERSFKNKNGIYDTDKISVTAWKDTAVTVKDMCKVGDIVGIRGRVQSYSVEKESQTFYNYEIIAEHFSFFD